VFEVTPQRDSFTLKDRGAQQKQFFQVVVRRKNIAPLLCHYSYCTVEVQEDGKQIVNNEIMDVTN
jgi:hypothetical protein